MDVAAEGGGGVSSANASGENVLMVVAVVRLWINDLRVETSSFDGVGAAPRDEDVC